MLEEGRFVYPYLDWAKSGKKDVPIDYGVEMRRNGIYQQYVEQSFRWIASLNAGMVKI